MAVTGKIISPNGEFAIRNPSDLRGDDYRNCKFSGNFNGAALTRAKLLHADFTTASLEGAHFSLNTRTILTARFSPVLNKVIGYDSSKTPRRAIRGIDRVDFDYAPKGTNGAYKVIGVKVDPHTGYLTCDVSRKLLQEMIKNPVNFANDLGLGSQQIPALEVFFDRIKHALENGITNGRTERAELPADHPLRKWIEPFAVKKTGPEPKI
ncbi:MAG: pentapeptide repeat-containing protein [Alphaproteobacteria bacterium]|nr:pentapeptide repeat-containing protein [Alphaproteobacteria bacterium]